MTRQLNEMLSDADQERAARAMDAMLKMSKIDVEELRRAADGEPVARASAR